MRRQLTLLVLPLGMLLAACAEGGPTGLSGGSEDDGPSAGAGNGTATGTPSSGSGAGANGPAPTALDDRTTDYNEALRTASIKLVRALPTLEQIKAIADASDKKKAYSTALDQL